MEAGGWLAAAFVCLWVSLASLGILGIVKDGNLEEDAASVLVPIVFATVAGGLALTSIIEAFRGKAPAAAITIFIVSLLMAIAVGLASLPSETYYFVWRPIESFP